jgi:hypothetical protein
MAHAQVPSFSNQELQTAVAKVRPILEGVDEARNRVSNDIKVLEAYLQRLDLKTPFRFSTGKGFVPPEGREELEAGNLREYGSAAGEIEEESLLWSDGGNGNFRLLYERNRWQGGIEADAPGGPLWWDDTSLRREVKPLIETKFEIRKRMYAYLPDFALGLAKGLDVNQQIQDDVPL